MVDLHTHDMFSRFDGFGAPLELAELAKELGHTSLATSNHGNTNGLVQTYNACKEVGIKAILGVEGYFLPVYKEQERGYHLCLFAKNLTGYKNLNKIQYEGEKQKYYNPIWTFELLEKYHGGLICTSACVASYSSRCILKNKILKAEKYLKKMVEIFGDDFYIEIQPYKVSEKGAQEKINTELIKLSEKLEIKCILTSDSHRGRKEDFDTYLKMHEMDGHDLAWIRGSYEERYKPTEKELVDRFVKMHKDDFDNMFYAANFAKKMIANLEEIEGKVENDILDGLQLELPKIGGQDSYKKIVKEVKKGLEERGVYVAKYIERCKKELDVIKTNGFIDYFLIVADYVRWAKERNICIGHGRGSVCNSLVAYALHITEVDSIRFDLDFRRFMRYDKKVIPDIDIDFETDRRQEVIEYIMKKYDGHAARVASYGLYKVDNTINELAKVCGLPVTKETDEAERKENKEIIAEIKQIVNFYIDDNGQLERDALFNGNHKRRVKEINAEYDNIFVHFSKLYGKVKYIGTHAAGVVVTSADVLQYTSLRLDKSGKLYACYDLEDLNSINLVKFDMLGLKTLQSIQECRNLSHMNGFDERAIDDKELMQEFKNGNTDGVFQVEKKSVKKMFNLIDCNCFDDLIAVNAMNRPGPLSQKQHELYAHNKKNIDEVKKSFYYEFTKDSFGTIIYQEQLMAICVNIGGFTWVEADKMLKITKHGGAQANANLKKEADKGNDFKKKFFNNAKKHGLSEQEIEKLWDALIVYSFNKGHAAGYALTMLEEMYQKHYFPVYFWYVKIKYAADEAEKERFCNKAAHDEIVIFLPHVNYSQSNTSLRKVDGEEVIQKGLADIKDVGEKAAEYIVEERKKNGIFYSYDNFYDRCKSRLVTTKVIDRLKECGALEFNKKKYLRGVITYNSSLYARN